MAKKDAVAENKVNDGKSEALKLAISQITKHFGDGSIMKLGENSKILPSLYLLYQNRHNELI